MLKFLSLITIVITLFGNRAYASDSMKQFQDNLEKITHQSTANSTVAIVRGSKIFKTSSKQANDDTQFYIGSASKHMTAYMMLATLHEKYPGVPLKELLDKKTHCERSHKPRGTERALEVATPSEKQTQMARLFLSSRHIGAKSDNDGILNTNKIQIK